MGTAKKKLLENPEGAFSIQIQSIKKEKSELASKAAAAFIAPELVDMTAPEDVSGFEDKPSWDVAVRFQDLKRFAHIPEKEKQRLKRRAIEGILDRAHRVMGSVLRPEYSAVVDYRTFLDKGGRGELDVLATLDEDLARGHSQGASPEEILRFDARIEKETPIALVMDASLSMTGEKIALLSVATAVVALCVPARRLSLMGFDSKVKWIKRFDEDLTVEGVIERVLELPAGGFTNMELALKTTLKALYSYRKEHSNVIFISDGKYTEGADPSALAPRFKHLNVLKLGRDQAGRDLLLEMTSRGNGRFFEARRISDLPKTMYGAMRTLLR